MNENAKLWIEALRGGDYKQTIWVLRRDDEDTPTSAYCCLGVACELYHQQTGKGEWKAVELPDVPYFIVSEAGDMERSSDIVLPLPVRKWLGLRSGGGDFIADGGIESLTDLNDSGKTFAEIADVVESEPRGLFA